MTFPNESIEEQLGKALKVAYFEELVNTTSDINLWTRIANRVEVRDLISYHNMREEEDED